MNCQKAHKDIHLFAELTKDEQTQVLNHIEKCEQCRELNESMRLMNSLVNRAAKVKLEPANHFQLTNRIMLTINEQDHQSINLLDWVLSCIELRQVKLAMAGISVLLIFLFGIELNQPVQGPSPYSSQIATDSKTSILNARKFQDQLNKYKSSVGQTSMLGCKDPFKVSQYNVACLREKIVHLKAL